MSLDREVELDSITEFLITPTKQGGMQLLLPGKFFQMMNNVTNLPNNVETHVALCENYKKYHEDRKNFIANGLQDRPLTNNIANFGLVGTEQMTDPQFDIITKAIFKPGGDKEVYKENENYFCPLCNHR